MSALLSKELLLLHGQVEETEKNRELVLKNKTSFIFCISKINDTVIYNAEDLDVVMPIHNLIECSKNYSRHWAVYGIIAEMK